MGAVDYFLPTTSKKGHGWFFIVTIAATASLALAWQPPHLPAVFIGRRYDGSSSRRAKRVSLCSLGSKTNEEKNPKPDTSESNNPFDDSEMMKDFTPTSPAASSKATAKVVSATDLDTVSASVATEDFSDFAANQTPLLAELLARNNTERRTIPMDSELLSSRDTEPDASSSLEEGLATRIVAWQEGSSELVVVGLATCALVGILGDLLANYEWVQTLRYFWPLSLGVYYGTLWNKANEKDASLRRATIEAFGPSAAFSPSEYSDNDHSNDKDGAIGLLVQIGYVFGGFGLFFGGLADALLPVWITGPNWITNAGLAPDCAILLLLLSVGDEYNLFANRNGDNSNGNNNSNNNNNMTDGNRLPEKNGFTDASNDASNGAMVGMAPLLLRITLWAQLYKLGEGSLDEVFCNLQTLLSAST